VPVFSQSSPQNRASGFFLAGWQWLVGKVQMTKKISLLFAWYLGDSNETEPKNNIFF
jgi:hypothetical protein